MWSQLLTSLMKVCSWSINDQCFFPSFPPSFLPLFLLTLGRERLTLPPSQRQGSGKSLTRTGSVFTPIALRGPQKTRPSQTKAASKERAAALHYPVYYGLDCHWVVVLVLSIKISFFFLIKKGVHMTIFLY